MSLLKNITGDDELFNETSNEIKNNNKSEYKEVKRGFTKVKSYQTEVKQYLKYNERNLLAISKETYQTIKCLDGRKYVRSSISIIISEPKDYSNPTSTIFKIITFQYIQKF